MSTAKTVSGRKALKAAWDAFISTGKVTRGIIREEIVESWQRCKSFGIDPYFKRIETDFSDEYKKRIISENKLLIDTARPFLLGLYDIIKSLEMVVFLTDKDGFILDAIGEGAIWEYCRAKNAVVGSSFNEKYTGTNAPAMALIHNKSYQMMVEEHYAEVVHVATCAAAPIHDENGAIIGSLDITASYENALKHPHTLGMIVAGAQVIENQLMLKKELEKSFLTSQYLKAAMESMLTGLVILSRDNVLTHINPAAEKILGVSASTVSDKQINNIIKNKRIIEAINGGHDLKDHELILQESIRKTRCLVSLGPISNLAGERMGSVLFIKELRVVQDLLQKVAGLQAHYTFEDIRGESQEIKSVVNLARLAAKSTSNILITGESGTGKEMIAQSLHNAGPWAAGPFLAINCAAIPHDLIESELFGYEAGTFTGGSRGGKSGKLELANGGTLFLDEVNGMSLDMQSKLLRILEEKKFQRLGGQSYFHLECRIIAATNKDLYTEIAEGNFRSDLYYRLSVLDIHVPPLRDRQGDVELLANILTQEISKKLGKKIDGISPEAFSYLKTQTWPGNVRQLKNWIERAVNLARSSTLTLENFPREKGPKGITGAEYSQGSVSPGTNDLSEIEKEAIRSVLEESHGNVSEAARRLGIGRATLYRKLKKYKLTLLKTVS